MSTLVPIAESVQPLAPEVSCKVFERNPEASFWVGQIAVGNVIETPEYYQGALKLRANVYIDDRHFLTPEHRNEHGLEKDCHDDDSMQFAIVEHLSESQEARVVGTSRLVMKSSLDKKLPIEEFFPEIFCATPAAVGSVEVSRLIAVHESRNTQHLLSLALIRAMTHAAVNNGVHDAYFVIEEPLWKLLNRIGIPMEKMAPAKTIEEYGNTVNMAVRLAPKEILDRVNTDKENVLPMTKFFRNENGHSGLGYFQDHFIRTTQDDN